LPLRITGIALGMLLTASQLSAHHSDADFDPYQLITLQGVVTTFRWVNPHIWVYLDVKDAATGKIAMWSVEGAPPGRIGGTGLRDALKAGDQVRITAYRAKNRSRNYARGYELTLADGRRFIIGPEAEKGADLQKHIDAAKPIRRR
jgi:hypothetical protein